MNPNSEQRRYHMRKIFTKQFWTSEGPTSQAFQRKAEKWDLFFQWLAWIMLPVGIGVLIFFFTHAGAAIIKGFTDSLMALK